MLGERPAAQAPVGYNKIAKLVEQIEAEGVISQAVHIGKRELRLPEGQLIAARLRSAPRQP